MFCKPKDGARHKFHSFARRKLGGKLKIVRKNTFPTIVPPSKFYGYGTTFSSYSQFIGVINDYITIVHPEILCL